MDKVNRYEIILYLSHESLRGENRIEENGRDNDSEFSKTFIYSKQDTRK